MEPPYDNLPGVVSTTSGDMGGKTRNPTYEAVSSGRIGHTEVLHAVFDSAKASHEKLLDVFWRNIDPTVKGRQFCDVGSQYRTALFYHSEAQRRLAGASKADLARTRPSKEPIVTPVEQAGDFSPAEAYHQGCYKKDPVRYYRTGCGRDERLRELWGKSVD